MPKKNADTQERLRALEKSVRETTSGVRRLERKVKKHERGIVTVAENLNIRAERESIIMEALGLDAKSRKGDRGSLSEITDSLLHLEEYLLRNAERIDNILVTLKNHREMLSKISGAYARTGEKERIKMELDIMRNTLSVLALAGIDLDVSLIKDVKSLQDGVVSGKMDMAELKRSKGQLDKKFDGELRRFDLEALYLKRKNIPGYV